MRLLYKPFAIVFGVLGGFLAKRLFARLWALVDRADPPAPDLRQTTWPKVLAAAAIEGVTFKVTRAALDRAGARGFERLTGVWPGPREPDSESE
jgi:hypothetical protein